MADPLADLLVAAFKKRKIGLYVSWTLPAASWHSLLT
jgi:hypothetical protein